MSVENIKAFSIVGVEEKLDQVVSILGKSGVFHPDEVSNFFSSTKGFTHIIASNKYTEPLSRITSAMNLLKIQADYVDISNFETDFEVLDKETTEVHNSAEELFENRKNAQLALNECKRAIEEAKHFQELDCNIEEILNMKYAKAFFGRLPRNNMGKLKKYKDELIEFLPGMEENDYIWGVFVAPVSSAGLAERVISRLHFEHSSFADFNDTPANKLKQLQEDLVTYQNNYEEANDSINRYIDENENRILQFYTKLSEYSLFDTIRTKAMLNESSFCLVGWVPAVNAKSLKKKLKDIAGVDVYVSNAKNELALSPPVKIKTHFFARPFQFYTEMYGVPKYNEIDPTTFIALTYVLLFGIMFGDIGHGLCVAIAGFLMWKLKKMAIGKILIPCGISGAVFGCIFGSIFGFEHALDGVYRAIGFEEKPIHVMDPAMTNTIIYVAVGIGMVLLCIAMGLNIYSSFRQRNYGKAIFDTSGIFGLIFYGMICAGIVGMLVLGVNLFSPVYIAIIALAFIMVFMREPLGKLVNGRRNWMPESWGGFIVENLFESIEVILSYVTNTMSFLRVGAFVLVHAGMMEVVFTLAETVGAGVGYWAVVVFGNALVCVLEALLVSIQVLRLEYYEMFSRFYSGEGRPYEPVKLSIKKN